MSLQFNSKPLIKDAILPASPTSNGAGSTKAPSEPAAIVSPQEAQNLNMALIQHMLTVLEDGRQQATNLYNRLRWTYWIIIVLATLMFLVGLTLISVPLWGPFTAWYVAASKSNDTTDAVDIAKDLWPTLIPAGVGALTFIGLFLFNPIARVQKLMGDMSQLIMMLNSFHIRVALRLVEIDSDDRQTIGAASEHVAEVAKSTLDWVETLFEQWLTSDLTRTTNEPAAPG